MRLEYDADGNVQKITGLIHSGKCYTITFISGSYHGIDNVGFITQQLVHLPVPSSNLNEALHLTYKIASALGEGPAGSGSANPVKPVSGIQNNRFLVNFFDTGINLYDIFTFINDGVRYINDGGPQLSELGVDPNNWDAPPDPANTESTIAIVQRGAPWWWCWLVRIFNIRL